MSNRHGTVYETPENVTLETDPSKKKLLLDSCVNLNEDEIAKRVINIPEYICSLQDKSKYFKRWQENSVENPLYRPSTTPAFNQSELSRNTTIATVSFLIEGACTQGLNKNTFFISTNQINSISKRVITLLEAMGVKIYRSNDLKDYEKSSSEKPQYEQVSLTEESINALCTKDAVAKAISIFGKYVGEHGKELKTCKYSKAIKFSNKQKSFDILDISEIIANIRNNKLDRSTVINNLKADLKLSDKVYRSILGKKVEKAEVKYKTLKTSAEPSVAEPSVKENNPEPEMFKDVIQSIKTNTNPVDLNVIKIIDSSILSSINSANIQVYNLLKDYVPENKIKEVNTIYHHTNLMVQGLSHMKKLHEKFV